MSFSADRIIAVRTAKTVYRDGDTTVKCFNAEYSGDAVLREAANQEYARKCGLPVPKVISVEKIEGKWAIISEFIKGETLSSLISKHPEKRAEYIDAFCKIQHRILSKPADNLPLQSAEMRADISHLLLTTEIRGELLLPLSRLTELSLCHGDLCFSNIVMSDENPFILDWSHACVGSAAAEAARSYVAIREESGKEDAEEYLAAFCDEKVKKSECEAFIPTAMAARAAALTEDERNLLVSKAMEIIKNKNKIKSKQGDKQ